MYQRRRAQVTKGLMLLLTVGLLLCYSIATGSEIGDTSFAPWEEYRQCGRTAFYLVAKIQAIDADWTTVGEWLGPGADGNHSFEELYCAAQRAGLHCLAISSINSDLVELPKPAIIQTASFDGSPRPHFSVLASANNRGAWLLDAPYGPRFYSVERLRKIWTGKALLFFGSSDELSAFSQRVKTARWYRLAEQAAMIASIFVWIIVAAHLSRSLIGISLKSKLSLARGAIRRGWVKVMAASTVLCAVVVLLVLSGFIPTGLANANPKIELPSRIDFGVIGAGEQLRYVKGRNLSNSTLKFSRIATTCGCVQVEDPGEIQPGEEFRVPLKIKAPPGAKRVDLQLISSTLPKPAVVQITTIGVSRPALCPSQLSFEVTPDLAVEHLVKIFFPGGVPDLIPQIVSVSGPAEIASFEMETNPPVFHRYGYTSPPYDVVGEVRMRVKLLPQSVVQAGKHHYSLRLKYGQEEYSYTVPISIKERTNLQLQSDSVIFTRSDFSNGNRSRMLALPQDDGATEYTIDQLPNWCRCSVVKVSGGGSALKIELLNVPDGKLISEQILLQETNNPTHRTVVKICFVDSA